MSYGKQIGDYIIEDELGKGAFGSVHKCRNTLDNSIHAIKIIRVDSLQNSEGIVGQLLKDEIQVLCKVDSPNVLKLEHYYQSKQNCYIIMEYSGDLERYWEQNNRILSEEKVIDIITQLLNGLRALHENNVIHRDLKLPNILMHKDQVKLADLGFCAQLQNKDMKVSLCLGSYGTMAPEVAKFEYYGLQSDIFSIGCIFYQLLFGELPFEFATPDQYLESIAAQKIDFKRNNVNVSQQVQNIISRMLIEDPNKRLTFPQLYEYQLFQNIKPKTQASVIAIKNMKNDNSKLFYTSFYEQIGGLQQKLGHEVVDMLKTQHIFNTKTQQNQEYCAPLQQENSAPIQQDCSYEDPRNVGSAYIQNVADLYNLMRHSNNLPIFQTTEPIMETEHLPSMAAVQQKVKHYEANLNALTFVQQVHDEIGNIKLSQVERTFFPKFMMLKKIKFQASQYYNEIQKKYHSVNELIKLKQKFKQIEQDQQITISLENITFNQSPQMEIKQEWMRELTLNLESNELHNIYLDSLKNLHSYMKSEANKIKEKKQLFIVILQVEQCMNFTLMEVQNRDYNAYFNDLRKKNVLELLKMISS